MQRTRIEEPLSDATIARWRVAIVAVAPIVILAGYLYHPHIRFLPDAAAVSHAVHADTSRWAVSHLGVAIGATLMSLAYIAIRGFLQDAGENRWSPRALPLLVIGATLYAFLPGMEFSVLAAAQTGGDVVAVQKAIDTWFVPVMMTSALTNGLGLVWLIIGLRRAGVLAGSMKGVVSIAIGLMAVSRFVPLGAVQFYVQGFAGLAALWPIAYALAKQTSQERLPHARPMPAF